MFGNAFRVGFREGGVDLVPLPLALTPYKGGAGDVFMCPSSEDAYVCQLAFQVLALLSILCFLSSFLSATLFADVVCFTFFVLSKARKPKPMRFGFVAVFPSASPPQRTRALFCHSPGSLRVGICVLTACWV